MFAHPRSDNLVSGLARVLAVGGAEVCKLQHTPHTWWRRRDRLGPPLPLAHQIRGVYIRQANYTPRDNWQTSAHHHLPDEHLGSRLDTGLPVGK